MKYEDLYDEFINLFPEDKEFFKRLEEETGAVRSIGMHIMFGLVVSPYILRLLEKEPEKAKKAFAGTEIKGKKLGIIGLGAIGVKVWVFNGEIYDHASTEEDAGGVLKKKTDDASRS